MKDRRIKRRKAGNMLKGRQMTMIRTGTKFPAILLFLCWYFPLLLIQHSSSLLSSCDAFSLFSLSSTRIRNNKNDNNNEFKASGSKLFNNLPRIEYFNPDDEEYNNSMGLVDLGNSDSINKILNTNNDDNDENARSSSVLLQAIQQCRRTAFQDDKQNFLNSERDFVAAKSVTDKKKLCTILLTDEDDNSGNDAVQVLGTADLQPKYKYVNKEYTYLPEGTITNVFVRPDQRGKKYGQRLMTEGVEQILVSQLVRNMNKENNKDKNDEGDNNNNDSSDSTKEVKLSLEVYTNNKPAIELYLKLGYKPDGPVHESMYKASKVFNSNLLVNLIKTVPVVE